MFSSKLPIHFWGHAILMATYIINITPTQVLNWSTPYKKLYNKDPTYDNLKVFGCLCFATNTIPHKTKFEKRATMCCFIGYNHGQKAYKLYDLQDKKIIMSRDVIFYESLFPYKSIKENSSGEKLVIPNEFEDFEVCANDFIPANDYNTDEFDIINEDEHFNFPEQQEGEEDMYAEENDIDNENHQNVPVADNLRFGLRERKKPSWHNDYIMHCNTIDATTSNTKQFTSPHFPPTYPYYHSALLTQTHKGLLSPISQIQEPTSYNEACRNEEWVKAMNKELDALENNQTWTVMPFPQNKKAIGSKWVYKVKLNPDGQLKGIKQD